MVGKGRFELSEPVARFPGVVAALQEGEADAPLTDEEVLLVRILRLDGVRDLWRRNKPRAEFGGIDADGRRVFDEEAYRRSQEHAQGGRRFLRAEFEFPIDRFPLLLAEDLGDWFRTVSRESRVAVATEWLTSLPIAAEDPVYVAGPPEQTLVVPWWLVIRRWETLLPDNCVRNVLDDDPGWLLLVNHDRLALFGCSHEYAHRMSAPVRRFVPGGDRRRAFAEARLRWDEGIRAAADELSG